MNRYSWNARTPALLFPWLGAFGLIAAGCASSGGGHQCGEGTVWVSGEGCVVAPQTDAGPSDSDDTEADAGTSGDSGPGDDDMNAKNLRDVVVFQSTEEKTNTEECRYRRRQCHYYPGRYECKYYDYEYYYEDCGSNEEIYAMNIDASALTRLTNTDADDVTPAFAPDGTWLVYTQRESGSSAGELFRMARDGTEQQRLTSNDQADYDAAVSPDGSRIAFVSTRDNDPEIYTMNATGGAVTRLTDRTGLDLNPAWSPDGSQIAFTSNRDGNREIYLMNADGSSVSRLTNNSDIDEQPSFSPDGSRIAFVSTRDNNRDIYTMNHEGTATTRLTTDGSIEGAPVYSQGSGDRILFHSNRNGPFQIYSMDSSDGGSVTQLTNTSGHDKHPSTAHGQRFGTAG